MYHDLDMLRIVVNPGGGVLVLCESRVAETQKNAPRAENLLDFIGIRCAL